MAGMAVKELGSGWNLHRNPCGFPKHAATSIIAMSATQIQTKTGRYKDILFGTNNYWTFDIEDFIKF